VSEAAILNRILNFVQRCGWIDYDDFSLKLAKEISSLRPRNPAELNEIISGFRTSFFALNKVSRKTFFDNFPASDVLETILKERVVEPLIFHDVFKETTTVSVEEGKSLVGLLQHIEERTIQDALQDSLRDLNATNQTERKHDSVLEVSDREHPSLVINGITRSFSLVVKGYNSVSGKTVTLKDVMHQIIRAYNRTQPDYILLVLAKYPEDSLISEYVQYGKSINNEYLVILCDPVNLARFLRARKII